MSYGPEYHMRSVCYGSECHKKSVRYGPEYHMRSVWFGSECHMRPICYGPGGRLGCVVWLIL